MNKRQAKKRLHKYIWLVNNDYRYTKYLKRKWENLDRYIITYGGITIHE